VSAVRLRVLLGDIYEVCPMMCASLFPVQLLIVLYCRAYNLK